MAEQVIMHTTTTEPGHLEPVLHDERGHGNEKPVHPSEGQFPLTATRESPHSKEDPVQPKINN